MENNWLKEKKEQIDYYLSSRDLIIPDRKRQLAIFRKAFDFFFPNKESLTLLDFGCGDGILSKIIFDAYPQNEFVFLDGSETMLEKAKSTFLNGKFEFIRKTFEVYIDMPHEYNRYDFIYSSLAIHHLDHENKARLYSKFHNELKHGGLFINLDIVLPSSEKTEAFQFAIWNDWIKEMIRINNIEDADSKHDDLNEIYKNKSENKPSSLRSQLRMLDDIGYTDVECYFKNGIFVVFGGRKI